MLKNKITVLFFVFQLSLLGQNVVRYDLFIADTTVNYSGKQAKALAINGQIPAPTLFFTEGDTAEIHVHNKLMHHSTSLHWHGLLVPNEQDGVPNLTTAPILPQTEHVYRFAIKQSGTYWYHSHTMLQEQVGLYGAIVIKKRQEKLVNNEVLLLSDWTDESPHQIERSLHYATDWYAIKKNATQSYAEAIASKSLGVKLENEWKRMHAMDVSDVYYNKFLVNGVAEDFAPKYKKGDKVRLRVINGSASTYFWLNYGGGKIAVVASDGQDVTPVMVDRLIVGVSEIYDIEVIIPEDGKMFEFAATSEDRMGKTSFWLGSGTKVAAMALGKLDYFKGMKMMNDMMTVGGNMHDMGMQMSLQKMDMNQVMYPEMMAKKTDTAQKEMHDHHMPTGGLVTLNYAMLKSPTKTTLPDTTTTTLHFELNGNMNRYVWTLDNKTISETDRIEVKAGQNVRMIIKNNSMMRHPMHLHGHFFRVVNGQGEYAPLKNVLDIMPMETDTIEFNASEDYGDWFFHCHILYHMMSGMGRIFRYENTPPNPQLPDAKSALKQVYKEDKRFFLGADISLETNGTDGAVSLMNTRWKHSAEWRVSFLPENGYETETHFGRYFGRKQFLYGYAGWDFRKRISQETNDNLFDQPNTKDNRSVAHIGIQYQLPGLIVADFSVTHTGYLRFSLLRDDIAITKRLRFWGMANSDFEYAFGARYIITKYISASTHYDSDMGFGIGATFTY